MQLSDIEYSECRDIPTEQIVALYRANGWSSAEKPELLRNALLHSHSLISAWLNTEMIGLGNALSDGYLVVYYSHLLVHPQYQGHGVGSELMRRLQEGYKGFHQQILVADGRAVAFYRRCGFVRAGSAEPMWIYSGQDH